MDFTGDPVLTHRAYQLDISRNRVPTLDTLFWLIDLLGRLRFTELHLYMEHTFAYPGHDVVWDNASPLTADELSRVRRRAAGTGLELVANLNCFGHMDRWLAHEPYRARAECPDGYPSLLGDGTAPPSCLAPTEDNAAFVVNLARQLIEVAGGDRIMIGGDEPFELGLGRSRSLVDGSGRGAVYRGHLQRIIEPLLADGLEVMIWGDQFRRDREAVDWVPDGVTVVPWNYEAPGRSWWGLLPPAFEERLGLPDDAEVGFEAHVRLLADAGVSYRAAAGTSTWATLIGRNGNAAANIADAVAVGTRRESAGLVLCDWGDHGHWQPLVVSLPSMVRAAYAAWYGSDILSPGDHRLDVGAVVDELLGSRPGSGALLDRVGHLGESLGAWTANGTPIGAAVFDVLFPLVGDVDHEAARSAIVTLADANGRWSELLPDTERGHIIAAELTAVCDAAALALRHLRGDVVTPAEVEAVRQSQVSAWLGSSRPGGLDRSLLAFQPRHLGP